MFSRVGVFEGGVYGTSSTRDRLAAGMIMDERVGLRVATYLFQALVTGGLVHHLKHLRGIADAQGSTGVSTATKTL